MLVHETRRRKKHTRASPDYSMLRSEVVRNCPPHGTPSGAQGVLVAHDDALFLRPGNGHVDTARVQHEPAEFVAEVAAANSGDDHNVRVRPLAGVHLPIEFKGRECRER